MAVLFTKISPTAVRIEWDFGDLEDCGPLETYRYTYTLKEGATTIATFGPSDFIGHNFEGLANGTYTVEVLLEIDTGIWSFCRTYIHPDSLTISLFCIPLAATNVRFSDLAVHYGVTPGEIRLSGPNNPSTGDNIFGKTLLPASGTISRARPNAVSELRDHCGGIVDNFNQWTVTLKYLGSSFTTEFGGITETYDWGIEWRNISTGVTQNTCPSNNSSVTFLCKANVINNWTIPLPPNPYQVVVKRSETVVHTTSRSSDTLGETSNSFVCTLSSGQTATISISRQVEVTQGCDEILTINLSALVTSSTINSVSNPVGFPDSATVGFIKEGDPCVTPPTTTSYVRYTGRLTEELRCGFKKDGNDGIFNTLTPHASAGSFTSCTYFESEREQAIQSNTTASVETIGAKSIKIGFTSLRSSITLTGTVTVKRLSDNVVVASASINKPPGTNLFTSTTDLTWSNAAADTKIGIEVDVDQSCIT